MDRTSRIEIMAIPMPQVRAVRCCWDFWRFCSFVALSARFWYLDFFSLIFYSLYRVIPTLFVLFIFRIGRRCRFGRFRGFWVSLRLFLSGSVGYFFRGGRLVMNRCLPWGWTVVCRVESRAFENDPYRWIYFMKRLLSAFRTVCKRVISKMLENIKLMTAGFTSISIRRHISILYTKTKNNRMLYEILINITNF